MSTISAWEHFLGTDWERYSQISSKATCIGCAAVGVMAILFGDGFFIGLWILFSAAILAVFDFPFVFVAVPNFERIKEFMSENLFLKLDEVKAVLYFFLSLGCFMHKSIVLFAGLGLMLTAILMAFSAVNRRVEAMDQSAAAGQGSNSTGGTSGSFVNILPQATALNPLNGNSGYNPSYQQLPQQSQQQQKSFTNTGTFNPHTGLPSGQSHQNQGTFGSYQDV